MRPLRLRVLLLTLGIVTLMLLGVGTATAGSARSSHVSIDQHAAAEEKPAGDAAMPEHSHHEEALHLLGACSAILAALVLIARHQRTDRSEAPVATAATLGGARGQATLGQGRYRPSRLVLCVQLC